MKKKFTFKAKGKKLPKHVEAVGVWTDGVMLSSDNGEMCDYLLEIGKEYRVTVERLEDQ